MEFIDSRYGVQRGVPLQWIVIARVWKLDIFGSLPLPRAKLFYVLLLRDSLRVRYPACV